MIRMFTDYARYHLVRNEEGQGTVEYVALTGVAIIGMIGLFVISDLGTWLANFLRTAIQGI